MRKPLILITKVIFAIVLLTYFSIWIFSPIASRYFINQALAPKQLKLSDDSSIRYNPFISHLQIKDLALTANDQPEPVATLAHFDFQIHLHQFLFNKANMPEITLKGASLNIEKSKDTVRIAGFELGTTEANDSSSDETDSENEQTQPLLALIELIKFENLTLNIKLDGHKHKLVFAQFQIDELIASKDHQELRVRSELSVNQAPILITSDISLANGKGTIVSDIKLSDFTLAKVQPHLTDHINSLQGLLSLSARSNITLANEKIDLAIPTLALKLKEFSVVTPDVSLGNTSKLNLDITTSAHIQLVNNDIEVLLPELTLNSTNIDVNQGDLTFTADMQKLIANKVQITVNQRAGINLHLPETEFFLDGFKLASPDLQLGHKQAARLHFTASPQLEMANDVLTLDLPTLAMDISELSAASQGISFEINRQLLKLEHLHTIIAKDEAPDAKGNIQYNANGILATVANDQQVLMQLNSLTLDGGKLVTENGVITAQANGLNLHNAVFSEDKANQTPPLARFEHLIFQQLKGSEKGADIDSIKLSGLKLNLALDGNKQLAGLILPPSSHAKTSSAESVEESAIGENTEVEATADKFLLALNQFSLGSNSEIQFTDNSVKPRYQRSFVINTLDVGPVSNELIEQPIKLSLSGKSNQYAHFDFSGSATPFSKVPKYELKGDFKEVSLPAISTYVKDALKYEFESGQLDLNLNVNVTGKKIDGKTRLLLRGLELTAADDHESKSLKDQTSMPFNVALGMLKDSKGNVKLDIPLSGETDSPSFGFSGFMALIAKQAAIAAAKDYVLTTFVPYANVVSIAMTAGEYLLKVRFKDLHFTPQVTALEPVHHTFLSQFAALLKEKSDTQVTLCAIATAEDLGKAPGTKITDTAEIEQLHQISQMRLEAFKQHMVENEGIPSSRLLLCTPQIDSDKKAKPRISFST